MAPAYNIRTGKWEQRLGHTTVTSNRRKIWYHAPGLYAGKVYVKLEPVGYIEMNDQYEEHVYSHLATGDPIKVFDAMLNIISLAVEQGQMTQDEAQSAMEFD